MNRRRPTVVLGKLLSVLPPVLLALLPRLGCPCQYPAYAGLLGWLGLAFLMQTKYLLPITAACLTFAVGGLAVGAERRHGYLPFGVGLLAAIGLIVGKFVIAFDPMVYGAIAVLLAASVWNAWPSKKRSKLRIDADGHVTEGDH
ncbi:hypothetical protein Mal15_46980 [Stieleria maiorica]|uniref:MerC mercury resistance protein n=1 Tax=Stieleria maiorica TaxID=2795974 RepID=A0A5B9MKU9_9BACT|nr:hypothetical protein [Stieleria maiorica]QEG00627.1 hypothetical protein Mal15_46980 [Stieleria maiorica]